jgi:N-acetyl sugar amidotransferase
MPAIKYPICSKCIYDSSVPKIEFNSQGVCNYCEMIDQLKIQFATGTSEGEIEFYRILEQIKRDGKGKKYDCVVGVSGGTDSSYMIIKAVEWGLRPLAVHYDNTWNTAIATENIRKVLGKLKVDLYTHVVDNKEADDIFKSFFLANVPEIDGSTDIALAETLYRAAAKYKLKYILEGHSFIAEGVSPLATAYIDGGYIKNVHRLFGKIPMRTFPNMEFMTFLKWILFYRIKKIRPLWYINYSKEEARDFLEKEYDWKYYGGHHLENRMTAFNHSVYFPQKFRIDDRNNGLSAAVRSGVMRREDAIAEYAKPPHIEPELIEYFKKRLGLSDEEYAKIMIGPKKSFRDYKTYKRRFERLRPLFFLLAKANLVPMSFYIKYTSKGEL